MIFCKSARPFLIRRIGAVFVGLSLMAVPTAALAAHAKAPAQRHRVVRYRGTVLQIGRAHV